jgi:hypothetical protein
MRYRVEFGLPGKAGSAMAAWARSDRIAASL